MAFDYLKDPKEARLSELRKEVIECCPPPEEADYLCIECARLAEENTGHIPIKAVKGFSYCADCYRILFNP